MAKKKPGTDRRSGSRRGRSAGPDSDEPNEPEWDPDPLAVWRQLRSVSDDEPVAIDLQHPRDPFIRGIADPDDEAALRSIAVSYLARIRELHLLPPEDPVSGATFDDWIAALAHENREGPVAWVPLDIKKLEGQAIVRASFASYCVDRGTDRSIVLIAAEQADGTFLGSGFGLKVVLHRQRLADSRFAIAIIGLTALLPPHAMQGAWRLRIERNFDSFLKKLQSLVAPLIAPKSLLVQGLRLVGTKDVKFDVHAVAVTPPVVTEAEEVVPSVSEAIVVRVTKVGEKTSASIVHRSLLIADMATNARDFPRDPDIGGSFRSYRAIRPTRTNDTLEAFRTPATIADPLDGAVPGVLFKVVPCPRFVRADAGLAPNAPRPIAPGGGLPPVRSDNASAVEAFHHTNDLFERMVAYGFDLARYFVCAKADVVIAYRSGISPGPDKDGQGVNARVLPDGWTPDKAGPPNAGPLPTLYLLLGLANRAVRAREKWVPGGGAMPAQPLGIGADANWMWHEFGHVLLMARTGELELRFAHSPGDALAAIVADPALDPKTRAGSVTRFATFPWVSLPRRHDRCAHQGWGWAGPVHAPLARVPSSLQPRRKAYLSEQILSSSLFRLYRCLGGDTAGNSPADSLRERERASHYSLYLVMMALLVSSDGRGVPVTTPVALVTDLCIADQVSGQWKATYPTIPYERTGGLASNTIRWAFEAQGLFGLPSTDPSGPGLSMPVDVYIPSLRPTVDAAAGDPTDYGPGSYVPVSLHWQATAASPAPAWQAASSGIAVGPGDAITVAVGNRGQVAATGVVVDAWWAPWPATDPAPPPWNDVRWTSAGATLQAPAIPPGPPIGVGAFPATGAAKRYVVLVRVTCSADKSLMDALSTAVPVPVIDLVAGDNNLGLLVVG